MLVHIVVLLVVAKLIRAPSSSSRWARRPTSGAQHPPHCGQRLFTGFGPRGRVAGRFGLRRGHRGRHPVHGMDARHLHVTWINLGASNRPSFLDLGGQ